MQDLLQSAIISIRAKSATKSSTDSSTFIPEEAHRGLYPILEIFGEESQDPDVDDKAKFIHEFLTNEQGTARDNIMHILNELPPISNETTLNRIWKYCRLKNEYRNTIKRAETLNQRMQKI